MRYIKYLYLISFLFLACASNNQALQKELEKQDKQELEKQIKQEKLQKFFNELDSYKNVMTYDDALLKWGEPTSNVEGKETYIVIWRNEKKGEITIAGPQGTTFTKQVIKGSELRLMFDKATNKMIKWEFKEL